MEDFDVPPVSESAAVFATVCAIVISWKIFFAGLAIAAIFLTALVKIRKKKREPTTKSEP